MMMMMMMMMKSESLYAQKNGTLVHKGHKHGNNSKLSNNSEQNNVIII